MAAVTVRERPARLPVRTTAGERRLLIICLAVGFTTLLDQSILTVAVPSLRASLGAGTADIQWMLAGYSLAFAVALVPAGRLGDAYGRKGFLIGGVAAFSLLSVVAATATSPTVLVTARLLQGAAAGTANPQVIGLVQDHFSGWQRTRALGAYATVASFSGIIAPLIGGAILTVGGHDGAWRMVVALNIPFGLVTAALAMRWVPGRSASPAGPAPGVGEPGASRAHQASVRRGARVRLDGVGLILFALATVSLLVPVIALSGSQSWVMTTSTWLWSIAALASALAFVVWERAYHRRGGTPILLPGLARSPGFALGTLVATFWFGATLGLSLVLMLFLQEGVGLSAFEAGFVTTPGAVASGICSALSWRLVARFGRRGVTVGLWVIVISLLATTAVVTWVPVAVVAVALAAAQVLTGVAGGLVHAPNQYLTLEHAPAGANGLAAAFLQVTQRVSATICFAALGGIFLASAVPGDLGTYRGAAAVGIAVTAALVAAAALSSMLADRFGEVTR
ncbi:Major Facilitator Superfamily protein [Sanguibacter gelidistatuariae]|uniref:Major Facilitator Superfamily protein n=1 Tax=Sanguibacter gelidistatuariae TaxID=1814289 RepID=A0A1G6HHJ0_9MICO|nr:MFS transporter [Sanguibacter gelidistatuariae]SDB93405.1 Major Facilitator Superfamily protein [Sanguibacter gelidistatuariae]